jgi:hypothetical protein
MSASETPAPVPEQEPEQEYPESWLPWKDAAQPRSLVGDVASYELGPDLGYGRNWICTVTDREGKPWSVWLSQKVLLGEFEEQRPMPGERIVLRYIGLQEEPKGGGPAYHRFRLTVEREQQLPEFLTRPQLEPGEEPSDSPSSLGVLPPGQVNVAEPNTEAVTDAEVVEERDALEGGEDDDPLPF